MDMKLGEREYYLGFGEKGLRGGKTVFEDKTPRDVGGLKYRDSASDVEGAVGYFGLIWDSTDHFGFICNRCGSIPNVDKVIFDIEEFYPTLRFYLHCQECGKSGQRKIYCNDVEKKRQRGMMQAVELRKVYDPRREQAED
jgi:hypothetical protein